MLVLDLQDHMHLIPVSLESLKFGMHVPMELQYGAANQIQQPTRSQPGKMHLRARTKRPDYEDDGSNAQ
jgi:hypothetical protein